MLILINEQNRSYPVVFEITEVGIHKIEANGRKTLPGGLVFQPLERMRIVFLYNS
jgi:hypothetical protein